MYRSLPLESIDYLLIGHVTQDLTPSGPVLGGTVYYASLAARALGYRVGIVTACEECISFPELDSLPVAGLLTGVTTTFENLQTPQGRVQILHQRAPALDISLVPDHWRSASIVHLAPVANEVDPGLARAFPDALVGVTPQGWMRAWDEKGRVHFTDWLEASYVLDRAAAAVLSLEDIHGDESYVQEFASSVRVLAVTEAAAGARVFWNGDVRRFRPPQVREVDSTGAGDIFAAAFFARLQTTRDPWEAGRFATHLAAFSVTRAGAAKLPTPDEIQSSMTEILEKF